jgi:phosphatidylglycerophosphate synthase
MRWKYAVLYPKTSGNEWNWLYDNPFAKPVLERIRLILKRAGIEQLRFADGNWSEDIDDNEPILLIKGGFLWKVELLHWFDNVIGSRDRLCLLLPDGQPFMISCHYRLWRHKLSDKSTFPTPEDLTEEKNNADPTLTELCPPHLLPVPSYSEDGILELAGKPSDRPHVVWVRRQLKPLLRFCAEKNVSPNALTWLGFAVHLIGCLLLLPKSYFMGIFATMVLILSWVLDCADGSLARVTMKESPEGKKLDTVLGNLSNIAVFVALIAREYGDRPLLAFGISGLMLSGILIAYFVHERMPKTSTTPAASRISNILTKINHRDYTLVLFVFALFDAFKVFVLLSLVGVHIYWIVDMTINRGGFRALLAKSQ